MKGADEVSGATRKVAVITGASSGIGRATAEEFARRGYDVAVLARRAELLTSLTAQLQKEHPSSKIIDIPCDISDWKQVSAAVEKLAAEFPHVNVLVNNAGAFEYQSLEKSAPEKLDEMINVNVRGVIYVSKAMLPLLKKGAIAGWSKIVNVSSISGLWGFSNMAVYTATKFAVAGFSSALRRELRGQGIQVATIYPGPVNTRLPKGKKPDKKMVMVPDQVAVQILTLATSSRRDQVTHPFFKGLHLLETFSPDSVDKLLKKIL